MTLERGTLLNNRYRIVEILGQGGMGSVYRAIDENLGLEVAVKENLFTTEEYNRQFRREANILANLRHPNLTRVTDHFVIEGQGQYLVMDYIEGEDLRQRMDRVGVLTEEEAIIIGVAVCDALGYLDSRTQPIVHRDIKPGNIKITPNGHIYLVDFGLAKILEGSHVTTTGARAMTPGYSPPEQYGTARTDHRSDLFSLGATLYAALTGTIPEDALARAMDQADLTTVRKRNPKISRRMASVLEKALEIRPDDRYQSAEDFKQALLGVRSISRRRTGEYTVAPPPDIPSEPISAPVQGPGNPVPIEYRSGGLGSPALPLPASVPLLDSAPVVRSPSTRIRPRRRKGGVLLALGFLALLFLFTAVVYASLPSLQDVVSARIPPQFSDLLFRDKNRAVGAGLPVQTETSTPTLEPIPSATPTERPSPTATLTEEIVVASIAPPVPTPTLTPGPTPVGGGDGMIAYASDENGTVQVWVMNVDGTGTRQVTNIPEGACQPDWSPDGTKLVFISPCDKNQELYRGSGLFLVNLDGTGMLPLTIGPGGDFDPAWSPDGTQIAFTSMRSGGRPQIYVINLADSNIELLSEQYSRDSQPSWSPDGQKIAFISSRKGISQIWTMDADGGNQKVFSQSGNQIDSHPVWSPDGQTMLFTQTNSLGVLPKLATASYNDQDYNEFTYDLGPLPAREARYSPDGLWVVFESWPEGSNHDIYIMAAGGAGRIRLTSSPRPDFDPVWKPASNQP